jgi:hypothetical protein
LLPTAPTMPATWVPWPQSSFGLPLRFRTESRARIRPAKSRMTVRRREQGACA